MPKEPLISTIEGPSANEKDAMTRTSPKQAGFTLVELLVVITIISLLAAMGISKIIGVRREADKTACKERLGTLYSELKLYETKKVNNKRLPTVSGSYFVLAVWGEPFIDREAKNFDNFLCPSLGMPILDEDAGDYKDLDLLAENGTHFAGRNQGEKEYRVGRTTSKGASKKIIICNKPLVEGEEPHAGECLCVLYLDGSTGVIERAAFGESFDDVEEMTIGEDSPVEALRGLIEN